MASARPAAPPAEQNTQLVVRTLASGEMQKQFQTLLPPSIKIDKFTEVTIAAIQSNPEVLTADKDSLYRSCLSAAKRGLLPDKREGALVVFNTNVGTQQAPKWVKLVQFMPMVEGIILEMAKAGIKAYAVSVYANDKIRLWNDDDGQHVEHEPMTFGDQGDFVGVFAAARTKDGRTYVEAMNKLDIEQVRARSKQKDNNGNPTGTWKTDYDRMAQKSALHRLRKRLPITDEDALANLKDMEEMTDIEPGDQTPPVGSSTAEAPAEPSSPSPAQPAKPARPAQPRRSRRLADIEAEEAEVVQPPPPEEHQQHPPEEEQAEEFGPDDIV